MPLVCPQCQQTYEQHTVCPLCNVVLMYHAENRQSESSSVHLEQPPQWQETPWGKIVIGLILAQGISFGLHHLLTAGFLVGDSPDVWGSLLGIVLLHGIHGLSLLIGGAVTGAGQRCGILYGALLGFANGVLTVLLSTAINEVPTSWLVVAIPLIHLAVGAVGGGLGMLIWRPAPRIPELDGPTPTPRLSSDFGLGQMFVGPIHMGRVSAGAFVVVVGVVWSNTILEFLLNASGGTLSITSHLQAHIVSLEISALVALIGAAFAGATTYNGLKQGLCVGLGASVVVVGLQMGNPKFVLGPVIVTVGGVLILTLVGGWFGGQLFPPLVRGKRRRPFSYY